MLNGRRASIKGNKKGCLIYYDSHPELVSGSLVAKIPSQVRNDELEIQTTLNFYNKSNTFSGGLPKTALLSFITIGRSISLG